MIAPPSVGICRLAHDIFIECFYHLNDENIVIISQ